MAERTHETLRRSDDVALEVVGIQIYLYRQRYFGLNTPQFVGNSSQAGGHAVICIIFRFYFTKWSQNVYTCSQYRPAR